MLNATVSQCLDEFLDLINQPRESSYVGNTSPAARQYLALLGNVGDELLEFLEWSQLKRIYPFTTQTGISEYQLPGDFLRTLTGTQWGVTNQIPLAGPLSNARLAFQTYGVNIATPYAGYQLNGAQGYIYNTNPYTQRSAGYFQISPPGQDNTTENVIAYTSQNYIWPRDWVVNTAYSVGDIRTGINNMYICVDAITTSVTRPSTTINTEADGDGFWSVYREPYAPTNDGDILLLDKNLFVDGLRAAWYEAKQQFAMADRIKQSWYSSVSTALGRSNGVTVVNAGIDLTSSLEWPVNSQSSWGPIPS